MSTYQCSHRKDICHRHCNLFYCPDTDCKLRRISASPSPCRQPRDRCYICSPCRYLMSIRNMNSGAVVKHLLVQLSQGVSPLQSFPRTRHRWQDGKKITLKGMHWVSAPYTSESLSASLTLSEIGVSWCSKYPWRFRGCSAYLIIPSGGGCSSER